MSGNHSNPNRRTRATAIDRYVGDRMRTLRCEREMGITDLAAKLGIAVDELLLIEEGKARASVGVLTRASKALGVEVVYFFEDDFKLKGAAAPPNVVALKRPKKK
ncbi:MAG: helix-turn-helix transcriptional regulator [Rhodospirillales bacterium]|nr:helix-turn-helix transcriptional regulator [Rhodospirillales bacterium]